jgi:carbonic anhydrase
MKNILYYTALLTLSAMLFGQTTADKQSAITPDQVLEELMTGNQRFMEGELTDPEIVDRRSKTHTGQFPKAVILSWADSNC